MTVADNAVKSGGWMRKLWFGVIGYICAALAFIAGIALTDAPASARSSSRYKAGVTAFQKAYAAYEAGDYATAQREYGKACNLGQAGACYNLGLLHANGKGVTADYAQAARYFERACDKDDAMACNDLGVLYQNARGVKLDKARAIILYRKACTLKPGLGCANLGDMLSDGLPEPGPSIDPRWVEVTALFRTACAEHAYGCMRYGYSLHEGLGVEKDLEAAAAAFDTACEDERSSACFNLGIAYEKGEGVGRDLIQAAQYYGRACAMNNAEGCNAFGGMTVTGRGVAQNGSEGVDLLKQACEGNVGQACGRVGLLLLAGDGVQGDPEGAQRFATKGCDLKDNDSCALLPLLAEGAKALSDYAARLRVIRLKIFGE
ncbi:hypothetical protein DMP17_08550 [Pseudonocardia sp. TMWB2A]|uniref:tetratricopeptide repeat protein n=1 Tax=Pseudonocardia sp. TMWB2A TaxID=687430 RepID=UPI00307DCE98